MNAMKIVRCDFGRSVGTAVPVLMSGASTAANGADGGP